MRGLVVNAGSSSLKLSVLDGDDLRLARELPAGGATRDVVAATVLIESETVVLVVPGVTVLGVNTQVLSVGSVVRLQVKVITDE